MDKKGAKTSSRAAKMEGSGGVSSVAYGAVASATGSGGAPTSFRSSYGSRHQPKLKKQERRGTKDVDQAAAAAAPLADLTTKLDFKASIKGKEKKDIKAMEYEEGQQQQTTITPMMPTGKIALPIPPGETASVASIEVDAKEDLPLSEAIPMDTMLDYSPASVTKKRKMPQKTLSQRAAAANKEKALKRARTVVVEPSPSTAPPATPHSAGLLEDPVPKKIASEEKDVSKDIAANNASEEKDEKQPAESSIKLQEGFTQEEVEPLTEPGELRKAAETSAAAKRDSEQTIEVSKAELEQTKPVSLTELQRIQSEVAEEKEEKNQRKRETEASSATVLPELERERSRSDGPTQAAVETERSSNSVATAEKLLVLTNEGKIAAETASMADKASRLEAAEAKTKYLEEQLAALHSAQEERLRLCGEQAERKMKELQAQLEAKFTREAEANSEELRECFKQEKEIIQRELDETAAQKIAATQIAEQVRRESERIKAEIENNRLAREAEERRHKAEVQEIRRAAREESERLNREKHALVKKIGDIDRLGKEDQTMTVDRYGSAATATPENSLYQNIVSAEVSGAMSTIKMEVTAQNRMALDDVAKNIEGLREEINSTGRKLTTQQDSRLAAGIERFGNLIKTSISKGEEIESAMLDMISQMDVKTAANQASVSAAIDVVKRLGDRTVEDMDQDDTSDTNMIRSAWNLIKQSLINMINNAYTEIENLRTAIGKSSTIRDKEYVESAQKAAEGHFFLLEKNEHLKDILEQLGIGVTPSPYDQIVPDSAKIEVRSVRNDSEDDINTINLKMSMASVAYREIETILSGVRGIAVHFANTERQSLQEIETSKIVANVEGSTASKLYYELERFYLGASTIEDVTLFREAMGQNPPLHKVFVDAIPFMRSRTDNKGIMEFLERKGYSVGEDRAGSIDDFFSRIMRVDLLEVSGRKQREMDENVFISTVIGILATVSEATQKINNKIEEDRKRTAIGAYFEEQLQKHVGLIAQQIQPGRPSLAAEMEGIEEEEGGTVAEELGRETPNIVKDSEEYHSRDIHILTDSALRETKNAYEDTLIKLIKQYSESLKIAQAQQLVQQHQLQEQLQTQKEQQCEQEYKKRALQEKQQTIDTLQEQQQHQDQTSPPPPPPPPPPPSSTPSRGSVVGNGEGASGGRRDGDFCHKRVFNAAMAEFRSGLTQDHDTLKKTVEDLIAALSNTAASSRISDSDLDNLRREVKTYIRDMDEKFRNRCVNLPIDVLQKFKSECVYQDMPSGLPTQQSMNISSVISEMGDELTRYEAKLFGRIAKLQDHDDMDVAETDPPREDETARLTREMKEQLTNALTRAAKAVELKNSGEKATEELHANGGGRNIKMFLKPGGGPEKNFVEVDLSNKDSGPRNINTEGLKKVLPDMSPAVHDKMRKASSSRPKKSEAASKNNTLTGKIFLDTLKDKVFPYSSKTALEDEDKEGGPAALHHPEYFRSSFSKHFIRDSTSFTKPPTFAEKTESVRNFTRLLEYSLFNDTARGARSDNDMLSKLIYVVFEHDAKMIRYLSDITYRFREYASGRRESGDGVRSISLCGDRGNLLEATIATVFSAALPVVSSMAPRIAEAVSEPVHDDVRIRSTYSLLSLIEKFIFCASKRVHVLKDILEKSGLVNRLSLYPADANADRVTSFDVQYDYSLLRMLLELMTFNITSLVDEGIRPLKTVVLSIGTFTGADKTSETVRAFIPIDEGRSVLSKASKDDIDVPKTISVVNYLEAVTDWYVANRFSGPSDVDAQESLNEAVDLMHTLLTDNLGAADELAGEFNTKLMNARPSTIVEYVSITCLPKLKTIIEEIVKKTKSNDAILVKGASEVGSLGKTAVNVSLGVSREHLALPWLEVDFRGGVDDSTLLWVLSGGVNNDEVVRDYQLAVPLYSSYSSIRRRSAAPLHVKPLSRIINNTSGSDNVFLPTNNNMKTPDQEEGGGGDRVHVVNLTKNVSCVLEYSTKDRYEAIINKMYRDGLVLVKGDAEVPRVFPTLDGKWMDNSRDNRTFTPLSVSRWKMPSASLVYGMLSKKKTKEEEQNQEDEENKNKTNASAPSVIDFMGGRAGNVLLEMLTLPPEQLATTRSSFDASSTNKGLWKTNKDGYTSIDAQSMMARLISDDKGAINNARTAATASAPSSMAMVPYSDAANVVVNDPVEVYNSNNSWWIRGIQPRMRRDAAALSAVQEHLFFVQTPIF